MYTYSPSEAGQNNSEYREYPAECNENRSTKNKCCTLKKTFVVAGVIIGVAVVFAAGYLVRHYFPDDSINDFLGHNKDNCKNITERQLKSAYP